MSRTPDLRASLKSSSKSTVGTPKAEASGRAIASVEPESTFLPVVPLPDWVAFPELTMPLHASRAISVDAISAAAETDDLVLLVTQRVARKKVDPDHLFRVGTVAKIIRRLRMPDGGVQVLMEGQHRASLEEVESVGSYLQARVVPLFSEAAPTLELEVLRRVIVAQVEAVADDTNLLAPEMVSMARRAADPSWLGDYITFSSDMSPHERQEILESLEPADRLRRVATYLTRQVEILNIRNKIQGEIQDGIEKVQRDFYLREQLKAIQRELGIANPQIDDSDELRARVRELDMPSEVEEKAAQEIARLEVTPPTSPEVGVIRGYLDWLLGMPWSVEAKGQESLARARKVLDRDHYGLEKAKERVLEFLAVRSISSEYRTPILCFVGPPGVGKTSLGRSIARSLRRDFGRISLGGVRDEAEIRGHRRTYVGALPGRIIQALRRAGSRNPVLLLDEIDKIGRDFRGDPSSALLEVLDPEQNQNFSDHYLEVTFDLSRILFVATANTAEDIPAVLRDRMEIIDLSGYTEEEKVRIAQRFLLPRQLKLHGLGASGVSFTDGAVREAIRHYTREAGVRNLERELAGVCRRLARRIASGSPSVLRVTPRQIRAARGPAKFLPEDESRDPKVGVATGLAVTPVGGEVLDVEAAWVAGGGKLRLTGQLGEMMSESAKAALSYARSRTEALGIDPKVFSQNDLHVHVPVGSVPKDGPSAGITMGTAIVSALTGRRVRRHIAMTGEVTLRGHVRPIGGLKEKVLAAHRAGLDTVVAPEDNQADLEEIPEKVRKQIRFVWVNDMETVLSTVLLSEASGVAAGAPLSAPRLA
ncbi:MAG TPA: endopeptidase La [Chloroflexi bacterium]|nr:endopeptidase La [Chloroflexota bacterium]